MGKYTVYSLEGCPYSMKAEQLFSDSSAKFKIIKVSQENKNEYKKDMNTFPQIYYERKNEKILVGGLSDLNEIINSNEIPKQKNINYVLYKSVHKNFK